MTESWADVGTCPTCENKSVYAMLDEADGGKEGGVFVGVCWCNVCQKRVSCSAAFAEPPSPPPGPLD